MPAKTHRNICWDSFHDMYAPVQWEPGHPLRKLFKYVCFSLEVGEESGKEHLQGWASPWHPSTMTAMINALHAQWPTANVQIMKGSIVTSEAYCSKENYMHEYGIKPNAPGVTNALLNYKHELDQGKRVLEVAEDDKYFGTYCQYRGGLKEYADYQALKRSRIAGYLKKEVEVIIGPTEVNKSRRVRDRYEPMQLYSMPDNTMQWAGNYNGEPVVLFDDVSHSDIMSITRFLRYCDGYPLEVPVKGGFKPWTPTHVYFTSNEPVAEWWPGSSDHHIAAVMRRITKVTDLYLNPE